MEDNNNFICENCGCKHNGTFGSGRFCSRSCANARHHNSQTKQKISNSVKSSPKFISEMEKRIGHKLHCYSKKQICAICGKEFELYDENRKRFSTSKTCSDECGKKYLSLRNKMFTGGFREGSVKNYKSGWYNNIHCDSSWELAFLIYCKEHNLNVERYKGFRHYIDCNGVQRKFYPDFIVDGVIYEIKGDQDENKIRKKESNKDIIFLYRNDIKPYLNYVIEKYGEDFVRLYDSKDKVDNKYLKKCPTCGKQFINKRTTYCSIKCSKANKSKNNCK